MDKTKAAAESFHQHPEKPDFVPGRTLNFLFLACDVSLCLMTTLVIATRNAHKVEEIRAILGNKFRFLTLNDFPAIPPVVENGKTFPENAQAKALHVAVWLARNFKQAVGKIEEGAPLCALADDSGLEVDALDGAPGIYSARFAALDSGDPGNSPDALNNAKLIRLLQNVPEEKRTGRFRCAIAVAYIPLASLTRKPLVTTPDGLAQHVSIFEGICEGRLALDPSGKNGFGYDPLFRPAGHKKSFAELGESEKNKMSHRAKALADVRNHLKSL